MAEKAENIKSNDAIDIWAFRERKNRSWGRIKYDSFESMSLLQSFKWLKIEIETRFVIKTRIKSLATF